MLDILSSFWFIEFKQREVLYIVFIVEGWNVENLNLYIDSVGELTPY